MYENYFRIQHLAYSNKYQHTLKSHTVLHNNNTILHIFPFVLSVLVFVLLRLPCQVAFQMALSLTRIALGFLFYAKCLSNSILIDFEGNEYPYLAKGLQENK